MYRLIVTLVMLLLSPFFMAQSCKQNCKDVACTEVFITVAVYVEDQQHAPVMLDEVYTTRKRSGERIEVSQEMGEGQFAVLDDSYKSKLANAKDEFRFVGMKGGKVVVDEAFVISADCCHVHKESGIDTVVIQ